jgi:hypothetical protein
MQGFTQTSNGRLSVMCADFLTLPRYLQGVNNDLNAFLQKVEKFSQQRRAH